MSERVIANGTDLMIFIREGEVAAYTYRPFAGQGNVELTREPNYRETNNKNLGGYKDYFLGLKGWAVSLDMDVADPSDVDADEVSYEELVAWEDAGTKIDIVVTYVSPLSDTDEDVAPDPSKPSYVGTVLVAAPMSGPSGENITSSVALQGCRKLVTVAAV